MIASRARRAAVITLDILGRTRENLAARLGLLEPFESMAPAEIPGWRELLLVTAGLAAAIGVVLHEQLADWYGVPDLGDPLFSMWRMGWVAHQVVADPRHLFDANTFYPEPGTLTYSDSMLLPALTSAPLIWMGVPLAVAYTILFLSAFLASGVATYLLARALTLSKGASWIAALVFALCQYRLAHYSHLELQMTQWMPLTLLAGHRLLATGRPRYAVYLMLAAGAQWYSSMYYGVFLTIYAGVFVSVLALAWRPGWGRFAAAVTGLVLGVGLALPLARVYKSTEGARGTRNAKVVESYSASPIDYLQPTHRSLYRSVHVAKRGRVSERELFPHFTPLALGAAGALPPLTAARLALLASGLVAFDGSLGFNGHWYQFAYEHFGPLKSMRVPARFAILVNLTLAIFAGVGAGRLASRARTPNAQRVIVAVFTAVFVIESLPDLRLQSVWKRPPALYLSLGPRGGAVLFEFPIRPDSVHENFPYIYFSTWHWTRTVNGYSGFTPASYRELGEKTAGFPLADTVAYLQQRGVTHVALHCAFWSDEACALTMERLAADPRFRLVASPQWQGKPAQLYELSR